MPDTLCDRACAVLNAPEPDEKVRLTREAARAWKDGVCTSIGKASLPARPGRPAHPILTAPSHMPKRSAGGPKGRIGLLHALAHIELNAIDLAWDIIVRFTGEDLPRAFYDDWVEVATDEAEHFAMLAEQLVAEGAAYGDLPAHDGLWEAAEKTSDDLLARLALVPMVLEARGLDTTPKTVEKLRRQGETASADILEHIAEEEIPHVAAGVRWFETVCDKRGLEPIATFRTLIAERHLSGLKPPFNIPARDRAGMAPGYYEQIN